MIPQLPPLLLLLHVFWPFATPATCVSHVVYVCLHDLSCEKENTQIWFTVCSWLLKHVSRTTCRSYPKVWICRYCLRHLMGNHARTLLYLTAWQTHRQCRVFTVSEKIFWNGPVAKLVCVVVGLIACPVLLYYCCSLQGLMCDVDTKILHNIAAVSLSWGKRK